MTRTLALGAPATLIPIFYYSPRKGNTLTDTRYAALIRWILHSHDSCMRIAEKHYATEWAKGEAAAMTDLLVWLEGFEGTDLAGLRERFAGDPGSTPEGK